MNSTNFRQLGQRIDRFAQRVRLRLMRTSLLDRVVPRDRVDLALLDNRDDGAWILARVCTELKRYVPRSSLMLDFRERLPEAKAYFYSHYSLYIQSLRANPWLRNRRHIVLFTHRRDIGLSEPELVRALNNAHLVIFMTQADCDYFVASGLDKARAAHWVFGADEDLFVPPSVERVPLASRRPVVGFCLGFRAHPHYRERKNYDFVVEIIKQLVADHDVLLVGQGFHGYERFGELLNLSRFTYAEPRYDDYVRFYQQMDVFVSASALEGGPVPLIESMMCNVVPVVSNTGFAPTVVRNRENGFIFDVPCSASEVVSLVRQALLLRRPVRESVLPYSWRAFSAHVAAALPP
jgi:glycosyltransferase involved in cell wall biosynthesis